MFDLNNFVIDRVIRGVMTNMAGEYLWSVTQITDPSIKVTADSEDVVDAMNSPITSFNRAKKAEFTANNSLFDLSLYAAQNGTKKQVASSSNKILAPIYEEIVASGANTTLKHTPKKPITEIFTINGDGTMGKRFTSASAASATEFVVSGTTLQFPTGLTSGTRLFVPYEYEAEEAVAVDVNGKDFPKSGKFVMEVLGQEVCNPDTKIYAYVIFPNAKLDANVDYTFSSTGKHPFTLKANQDYCDPDKTLARIVVPKE